MKAYAGVFLAIAATVSARQAASGDQPALAGKVTGRIICADTDKPGRFANVQLVVEKPAQSGFSGLDRMGKNPAFDKAVSGLLGSMLKRFRPFHSLGDRWKLRPG